MLHRTGHSLSWAKSNADTTLRFDDESYALLHASIREQEYDAARAVAIAQTLANNCIDAANLDPQYKTLFRPGLVSKLCGYNAQLHAWAVRYLRAQSASKRFLSGFTQLDYQRNTLSIGEHFMLATANAMGIEVSYKHSPELLRQSLAQTVSPHSRSSHYERTELCLHRSHTTRHERDIQANSTLFFATMETYVAPMIEVAAQLHARNSPVVFALPAAWSNWACAERLRRFRVVTIETLGDDSGNKSTGNDNKIDSFGLTRFVPSLMFEGCDFFPLVGEDAACTITDYVPYLSSLHSDLVTLLRNANIRRAVVARLRRATELLFAKIAAEMNVECTMLMHGHISPHPDRHFVDGEFQSCTRVLVWGEQQKSAIKNKLSVLDQSLSNADAPDTISALPEIRIVGNPCWDHAHYCNHAHGKNESQKTTDDQLASDTSTPATITYIGQPDSFCQFPELLRVFAASTTSGNLHVRPHPSESLESYASLIKESRCDRVILRPAGEVSLSDELQRSTAIITLHSTVNLEAIAYRTSVITLALGKLSSQDRLVDLSASGLPFVTSSPQLATLLEQVTTNPQAWRQAMHPAVSTVRAQWAMDGRSAHDCALAIVSTHY